jgi:hypothetical protein
MITVATETRQIRRRSRRDPAVLDVLGITLGKEGYRVILAGSGEESLAQARAEAR